MVAYLTKIRRIHINIFREAITSIRKIYFWSCWFVCLSVCLSVRRLHFGVIRITIWINGSDYIMDPVRVLHAAFTRDVYRHRTNSLTLNRQIIQAEFSPTSSCVSLTRSTASSELKLFKFDKMEVNCFQILLIDVTFYL